MSDHVTHKSTSGVTAKATTANAAIEVIAATNAKIFRHVRIVNEGAVAGFFSIDGGTNWERLPASAVVTDDGIFIKNMAIQIKRISGGSDLSGVFGAAW